MNKLKNYRIKDIKAYVELSLVFLSSLFFSACIDLINDEFPPTEPIPVVNSILVMDSNIEVHVSKIVGIDSTAVPIIDNALINLYKDGEFIEIIPLAGRGIYKSNILAEERSKFSCVIIIPGYDELYCSDSIPAPLSVKITGHTNRAGLTEEGAYYPSIDFTFDDDPTTEDYYEVLLLQKMKYDFYYSISAFNETYDFLLNEGFEPYSTSTLLFSDQLLNSEMKSLTLNYGMGGGVTCMDGNCWQSIDEHTIIIEVRRVSQEYYKFKKQFYLYEKGRYGELLEGVVSPFQMYSNIENGKGIFAAYSVAIDSIHIQEETIPLK